MSNSRCTECHTILDNDEDNVCAKCFQEASVSEFPELVFTVYPPARYSTSGQWTGRCILGNKLSQIVVKGRDEQNCRDVIDTAACILGFRAVIDTP